MAKYEERNIPSEEQQEGYLKGRYSKLMSDRTAVLMRARECSALTIPTLLPPEESNTQSQTLPTPYQSLGARGLNNLASKLLLTLFPPNSPFFRFVVSDQTLTELNAMGKRALVEEQLGKREREVMIWIETHALRVFAFEALKLLICTGNCVVYLSDEGKMKVYKLNQYVVRRDSEGNLIELIIKESIHPEALPEEIQKQIQADDSVDQKPVDLYTQIKRVDNKMVVVQEVKGIPHPEGSGKYTLDRCPWLVLRWTAVSGEDYGRGLVEEYLGDFRSLEGLSKAILDFSTAASKVINLVDPNSVTSIKALEKAKSGDYVRGNKNDITCYQVEKYNDFQIVQTTVATLTQRLSQAFLLTSSIQRDAERVTAEEIRALVKELEDSLGGAYSVLSQDYQLPLVKLILYQMEKAKDLPGLPEGIIEPMIVTGLEALGRGNDLNKLVTFKQLIADIPEATQYMNVGDYIKRVGTSLGMDMDGLIKSDEEIAMMKNQALIAQVAQGAIPGVAQEYVKGAMNQQNASEEQE